MAGAYPIVQFTVSAGEEVFIGLGNGLTVVPSDLNFSCANPSSGNDTKFVLLGQ